MQSFDVVDDDDDDDVVIDVDDDDVVHSSLIHAFIHSFYFMIVIFLSDCLYIF